MDEEQQKQISDYIYSIIVGIKDTFRLPTHSTLLLTLEYAALLLVCSIVSTLFHFYTFISWQGALLCVLALGVLIFIERSENDEIMQMYRNAQTQFNSAKDKAKELGNKIKNK